MEVHNILGHGFHEIVYKDALEYEFKWQNISFNREKKFQIPYKGIVLDRHYQVDFLMMDKIILEVKCYGGIIENHLRQTINYLAVSKCRLGIIVNFGKSSLEYKRVLL